MDISKELPDPLPVHWNELEGKMRKLLDEYPLQDIVGIGYVFNREYADRKVVEVLKGLLDVYHCVKSFHVYYGASSEDGSGCFHIYPEVLPLRIHEQHVVKACRSAEFTWLKDNLKSTGDRIEFIYLREAFKQFAERHGSRTVVIDRVTV